MTNSQLQDFLKKVKNDSGLQAKLKNANSAQSVVETAKEAGFTINASELEMAKAEISEKDLESVAGGGGDCIQLMATTACTMPTNVPYLCNK